jgi:hypothetical protein
MTDDWKPILLSAKVFGHISQGLYRTPAGAIKELISNAFDADASLVRIHTDFPRFEIFSCSDNGVGMSQDEFRRLMNRGIGTSNKRTSTSGTSEIHKRPLIGRLGLGILSVAQICTQFDLVAHHKESQTAFRVTIKFLAYTRQEMDKIVRRSQSEEEIEGGEYRVTEEKYDSSKQGVQISTRHLREQFRKRMQSTLTLSKKKSSVAKPYKTFDDFLKSIYERPLPSLILRSDYDQLLFGLALAPPLPLVEGRNVALYLPMIRERQAELRKFDFEVRLDNLLLTHPVHLPSDREGHTARQCTLKNSESRKFQLTDGPWKETCQVLQHNVAVENSDVTFRLYEMQYSNSVVAGRPLAFNGYLVQQIGRLYPRDIQGILIRLQNVAIGKYDTTIMAYPYAEGPRYSMVSSELFVQEGFEDALNIDRDSFNELHPHYIRTQCYIHQLLQQLIFPETWGEEKKRNRKRRDKAAQTSKRHFLQGYRQVVGETISSIEIVEKDHRPGAAATASSDPPVKIVAREKKVEIDRNHPLLAPLFKRRKYAALVEKLVLAFERASEERGAERRRELFYQLLNEIFSTS